MELFQIDDLRTLAEYRQWPCVSLFLPTHRAGKDMREDPIRLKNAVGRAKEQLAEAGYPRERTAALLEPAAGLVTSRDFWLHQADGLAVFAAPGLFQYYRVPLRLQDDVVVADYFSVKPLIPLFSEDSRFYVLALSQKQIRLFEATRTSIEERAVPEMLKGIDDLRQFDEAQRQLQSHTLALTGTARTNIIFHGQGGAGDRANYKAGVIRYVNAVSKKLEKYLNGQTAPLVLAAVEYEQSFYRQATSYPNLLDEGILGNPDDLDDERIRAAAWTIVEPRLAQARADSLRHFADLSNTGKTSVHLQEILPAAYNGRVRTLFIQMHARTWGTFDPQRLSVETRENPAKGDVDLIDLVTIHVLLNRGKVYALRREEMPTDGLQAAIFRY